MALPYTFTNGTLANADEVNANFNFVTRTYIGSTALNNLESGANYVSIGSFVIGPGSLNNPTLMNFTVRTDGTPNGNRANPQIEISGASANTFINLYTTNTFTNSPVYGMGVILAGSPFSGFMQSLADGTLNGAVPSTAIQGNKPLSNLDTSATVVFKFAIQTDTAGSKFVAYGITTK